MQTAAKAFLDKHKFDFFDDARHPALERLLAGAAVQEKHGHYRFSDGSVLVVDPAASSVTTRDN